MFTCRPRGRNLLRPDPAAIPENNYASRRCSPASRRGILLALTGSGNYRALPFFKTLEQFILTDMGSHVLDAARYLFGEARSVYCQTRRVHHDIRGEDDVATVMMDMSPETAAGKSPRAAAHAQGVTVLCQLAYADAIGAGA